MKTTVIIPARNEERLIGATLDSLPSDLVDPIVAVNGSSDGTAKVASELGARVVEIEQAGKLPAIQFTLESLGERALEPLILLDADTRPIMPRRWHKKMLGYLRGSGLDEPAAVGGPTWFNESGVLSSVVTSMWVAHRFRQLEKDQPEDSIGRAGPNMGLYIQNKRVLEQVLSLEHFWPGEDRAMIHTVQTNSGKYVQPQDPSMYTLTRIPSSLPSVNERIRMGREESARRKLEGYVERAPIGSKPFWL